MLNAVPVSSHISRSARRGSSSTPPSGPNTIVGLATEYSAAHGHNASQDGSPCRAKATQASCICSESAVASGPAPVNGCTAGSSTLPKTKGISSPWHDPNIPPRNGDCHVNRYAYVFVWYFAYAEASANNGSRNT